jgi:RHS repeat-associated protein
VNYTFTGQEEDEEIGLYNYNARLYDPVLGRFISADSIVPDPGDLQALNRYSYCLNNPLIYTDPSGNFFILDDAVEIGILIGAALGASTSAITGGNIWQGALTGAISGGFFAWAGSTIEILNAGLAAYGGLPSVVQVGLHAAAGTISGGINAAITGGDIGMGALTGGISGGMAEGLGGYIPHVGNKYADFGIQLGGHALIGGVTGGIAETMYGGDFWHGFGQGAWTGAYGFLFNKTYHGLATMYNLVGNDRADKKPFDPNADSAAMTVDKVPKLGTNVTTTYVDGNGKVHTITSTVDDRGPFERGPDGRALKPLRPDPNIIIDLTPKQMRELTGKPYNTVPVTVEVP